MAMAALKNAKSSSQKSLEKRVLALLEQLNNGSSAETALKTIFRSELNYDTVNVAISKGSWSEPLQELVVGSPKIVASAGENNLFHIIHIQLHADKLFFGVERAIIGELRKTHPYALFIFSNSANSHWHFINVKHDATRHGHQVIRRIVVSENERLRTACERLSALDIGTIHSEPSLISPLDIQKLHEKAFDIEKVHKAFFDSFIDIYGKVVSDIRKVLPDRVPSDALAQLFIDRLLFLYFIQKKGWLAGDCKYLYERFKSCLSEGGSYYETVLEPLFEKLSGKSPSGSHDIGHIPFLNGGLFEHRELDQPAFRSISNATFAAMFDQLLERYNFTVTEDTPLDEEVAIDPEMLGKIFERLVLQRHNEPDKDLRKLSGSYYTPRNIVHHMSQGALREYLAQKMAQSCGSTEADWRIRLETFLALPPGEQLSERQLVELRNLISTGDAENLRRYIFECTVCDPSVGSGAFVIGMLHEMVSCIGKVDLVLGHFDSVRSPNYAYTIKQQLIEKCLYGVDIQPQAVRLCELRLWLSLVVDYSLDTALPFDVAISAIPSLPNLSYKIVAADSLLERLLGQVISFKTGFTDSEKRSIQELCNQKDSFFNERRATAKQELDRLIGVKVLELADKLIEHEQTVEQHSILDLPQTKARNQAKVAFDARNAELESLSCKVNELKQKLLASAESGIQRTKNKAPLMVPSIELDSFMWKLQFIEVFAKNEGFSIVIANPPYRGHGLRGNKKADTSWTDRIRVLFPGSAEYKIEQYALFLELAFRITGPGGIVSYITPDSFLLGQFFEKIRRTILERSAIRNIIQFEDDFWKAGVVGRPTILLAQKQGNVGTLTASYTQNEEELVAGRIKSHSYQQHYFQQIPRKRFRLFYAEIAKTFVEHIESGSQPLQSIAHIWSGVRSKIGQENIVSTEQSNSEWHRGITSGSLVQQFEQVRWEGEYLHIEESILWKGGWDPILVGQPKLMIRQTGDTLISGLDYAGLYHLNNVHGLSLLQDASVLLANARSLEFVCAVLNSALMRRYYHLISLEFGRTMAQTDIETLHLLPIREPSTEALAEITTLLRMPNDSAIERINQIIENLYGLDERLRRYLHQSEFYPDYEL